MGGWWEKLILKLTAIGKSLFEKFKGQLISSVGFGVDDQLTMILMMSYKMFLINNFSFFFKPSLIIELTSVAVKHLA